MSPCYKSSPVLLTVPACHSMRGRYLLDRHLRLSETPHLFGRCRSLAPMASSVWCLQLNRGVRSCQRSAVRPLAM